MNQAIPFFLYGTARQHEPLHAAIEHIVERIWCGVTAPSMKLMIPDRDQEPAYPYLVRTQQPTAGPGVYGDLCLLRRSASLDDLVKMELSVGYDLEGIRIEKSVFSPYPFALAFVWTRSTVKMRPLGAPSWKFRKELLAPA